MSKIFSDGAISRTVKIAEPFSLKSLEQTFEGWLLYALVTDDAPCQLSGDADRVFLGSNEVWREGHLMFAGDVSGLRQFIAVARTSDSRCAKLLLPALERELLLTLDNCDHPCSIDMASVKSPDGKVTSITIPEILQDLLIQHPDLCASDHFTVSGHYGPEAEPDHLGGYAFFITADDIRYHRTDKWLLAMRSEHIARNTLGL